MRVIIEPDYQKMSQWAAEHVIELLHLRECMPA